MVRRLQSQLLAKYLVNFSMLPFVPEGDQYVLKEGVKVIPLEQFLSAGILD